MCGNSLSHRSKVVTISLPHLVYMYDKTHVYKQKNEDNYVSTGYLLDVSALSCPSSPLTEASITLHPSSCFLSLSCHGPPLVILTPTMIAVDWTPYPSIGQAVFIHSK